VPEAAAAPAAATGQDRPPAAASGSTTVTPFPAARAGRRRSLAPLSAAAAVLVVATAAVVGLGQLGSGGSSVDSATSAPAGGEAGPTADFGALARNETGTDYAADGALAAALPALVDGSAAPQPVPAAAPRQEAQTESSSPELADQPVSGAPGPSAPQDAPGGAAGGADLNGLGAARAGSPELDRLRTPEGLASCLAALLPPEEPDLRPLAVDYAAYAGRPALVVLLPATGGVPKVDVFVVGAGCTTGDDQTLFFGRFDAP
jgi:hypothetical protein